MQRNNRKTQKKNNKTKKNKPRRRVVAAERSAVYFPHLSECTTNYLKALSDPFDLGSELPCVPDVISLPSHKYQTKVRGSFTVGTNGVGWVAFDPFTMATNNTGPSGTSSDQPIVNTLSTFTGTSYASTGAGGVYPTGVTGAAALSPFSNADIRDNVTRQIRLVGAGIRARYMGTELNRGGNAVLVKNYSNQTFAQGLTSGQLLQQFNASQEPVDRRWKGVTYTPDATKFLDYSNYADFLYSSGAVGEDRTHRSMMIYVDGAVAGTSFQYEAVAYFELIGNNIDTTPSLADPVGYGAVMSTIPEMARNFGAQSFNVAKGLAYKALERTTSGLVTIGAASMYRTLSAYGTNGMLPLTNGPTITEL